jgi:hypothetical protein
MSTVQDISSADSLIPNGNFVQGVAYWRPDVGAEGEVLEHIQFRADHENDPSLKRGEPKYGLETSDHVNCYLNRNDLFTYPILRFLTGLTVTPIKKNAILITQGSDGDFWVEDVDWATVYTAVLDRDGLMRVIIDRATVIRRGAVLMWTRPEDGTLMPVVIQSEDRTDRGVDFRSFQVVRQDGNPITDADTGGTIAEPLGASTVNFVVRSRPQVGSTVTLWAVDDAYSGHYVINKVTDTDIVAVPEDQTLDLIAEDGDVGGIVYNRNEGPVTYNMRVLDGSLDVSPGDYFIAEAPFWAYGQVTSVVVDLGVQIISVSTVGRPPPVTGPGVNRAITGWAFAPAITSDMELPITGCRYELTLAFTSNLWDDWDIDLQFIKEEGASQALVEVIDTMRFTKIREFFVSEGSLYKRYIYRLRSDRPLPIPGLPRIRFEKPSGASMRLGHVLMYRGDFTGQADQGEALSTTEFEQLEYTAAPDGGLTPKGVIIAYTGGTTCPPGYSEVVAYPGDTTTPSNVLYTIDDLRVEDATYDATRDVTTLIFKDDQLPLSVSTQDSFSSHPWSSSRVLTEIVKRDAPAPPRYRLRLKLDRIRITLVDRTLPRPPPRPPRFEYVNIGLLKPAIVPGMFFQIVNDPVGGDAFYGKYREAPDDVMNALIVGVRVAPEFVAYENGSSADPTNNPKLSYPTSYNNLASDLSFWSIVPNPFAIFSVVVTLGTIYNNIRAVALYDPRRTGEPLPEVNAFPVEGGHTLTYIDLQGDWRAALSADGDKKGRIIKTGYLKVDADEPGFADVGAEEHNHRIEPSEDLSLIQPSNVYRPNLSDDENFPPVLVRHGHNYLGTGGYSRPKARVVKLCVKE